MRSKKRLYHLTQDIVTGYDTYSDCIVCAESEEEARNIHPSNFYKGHDGHWWFRYTDGREEIENDPGDWCKISEVTVKDIGSANHDIEIGVVCSSFHAG